MEQKNTNPIVVLTTTPEEITSILETVIRKEIRNKEEESLQEKFLSPKEACKIFSPSISLVTLDTWSKKGLLTKHHISGRTYYRYRELIESLTSLKKYQRQSF